MTEWTCLTFYTRCNNVWNCPDGRDELHCSPSGLSDLHCQSRSHFCLNVSTGDPTCLSVRQAGNGTVDCVGSVDEREFCRTLYPYEHTRRYRCRNANMCILLTEICDCLQHCPENDDETTACHWLNNGREPLCDQNQFRCRNNVYINEISRVSLCHDSPYDKCADAEHLLFCDQLDNAASQPIITNDIEEYPPTQNRLVVRRFTDDEQFVRWYCNRGVYVRSSVDPPGFYCFCPDSYYGDRCQYQRKRLGIHLQIRSTSLFDPSRSTVKLVILLVRHGETDRIISHEQTVYTPQRFCLPRFAIPLYYPINESLLSPTNHSVHIYAFSALALEFRAMWKFPLSFEFLPVNRIAKQLLIPDSNSMQKTSFKPLDCRTCSNVSLYLGYDTDLQQEICVCPLDRTGRRCLIPFNPCNEMSCSRHGKCLPVEARHYLTYQFICLCNIEWFGDQCEQMKARIDLLFPPEIPLPQSSIVFAHAIDVPGAYEPTHFTYFHRLSPKISTATFFFDSSALYNLVFLQTFEHSNQYDYYLVLLQKTNSSPLSNITSTLRLSHRCRKITELFNSTELHQAPLRRVKNYQKPCLNQDLQNSLRCFYDDELMCLCDETNHTNCFNFRSNSHNCLENRCNHRGLCVQDRQLCPKSSLCLCEPCSYGTVCQFSSAGYALSLDAILGSHILPMVFDIRQQSKVVQISFALIIVLVLSGTVFNLFAIGTFQQRITHEVGSGIYLLISSCLGLLTIIALLLKIVFLLQIDQNDLQCASIGFLLKWWSTSCEWIDACVSIERTLAVKRKTKFSRATSKRLAKWIWIVIVAVLAGICSPELIFYRTVIDTQDTRLWCVFTLNADRFVSSTLYSVSTILLFLLPLVVNISSGIYIVLGRSRTKQQATSTERTSSTITLNIRVITLRISVVSGQRIRSIKKEFIRHKYILIAPAILSILGLPRLIFAFVFVCTKLDQRPYSALAGYLIAFLPSIATLFVFVLPSASYRNALRMFLEKCKPSRFLNYFDSDRRR